MVESKCIEVDANQMPPTSDPLDVTRYLLMIPNAKLILIQDAEIMIDGTVRTWFIKIQQDATKGDNKPSTLESAKDMPAAGQDLSTAQDAPPTTPKTVQ